MLKPFVRSFTNATSYRNMEAVVKKALKEVEAKKRSSWPWKFDEPHKQPCYVFAKNEWKATEAATSNTSGPSEITKIALYSWNIDFMLPFAESRMNTGISHLQSLINQRSEKGSTASVIYLQECVASDLDLIASHPWVRETFALTDLDLSNWQSGHYGTVSLIDKRLPITSCIRVHYSQTRMERDVLIVDVRAKDQTIRLCNSHLESLALEPPYRPPQMKLIAQYMRDKTVDGAVVAGDFNAIQPFDRNLHSDNGLKDAYLEHGGGEDDPAGHTWGQQAATALRKQFGTSRMDKVYFSGSLHLHFFEKFGADVCLDDKTERETIASLGFERGWITDHLGVIAVFGLSGSIRERI